MLGRILKKLNDVRLYAARRDAGFVRVISVLVAIIAIPVTLLYLAPALLIWTAPALDLSKDLYAVNRPIAFTFLDVDGHVAGRRGAIVGERIRLDQMPTYLPAAFIAVEDRRFYENDGIDIRGLMRAAWMNFRAGHVVAGGSTITQQTAKIVFLSPTRTFVRKYEELLDAAALQKSLNKKQILELYLNRIYLGSGAYGVDGAAHIYFGKSARDLTLSEAAMLATLTRAPSAFSPRRDLAAAQERAGRVLHAMVETRAITEAQATDASAHPAVISDRRLADAGNFYLDTAGDEALRLVGSAGEARDGDLIVHTALEPRLQESARHALAHSLNVHGRRARASEGAIVVMKTDGAVSALIGGRDYDTSVFNRATQAKRQPGSAFKPFVYLAAVEKGISPWDVREDGPVDIDGWTPTNYGGRSYGTVTLADALAHSINTVTAGLAQEVGIKTVIDAAHRCGISSPLAADASLALGTSVVTPLELTTAYATFASGGMRVEPYLVTEIEDSSHNLLYQRKTQAGLRVVAQEVNRDLTAMLYGVLVEGTGRAAALPDREAAGKTGTTQDYRDAWFVGFTPDYVAGVWVGNDDYSPMRNVTGGSLPAAIWKEVMTTAERGLPVKTLDKSSQPPPEDAEDAATETASADETAANDESANNASGGDESTAQQQPAQQMKSEHRTFWSWLFGNDDSGSQAPQRQTRASADDQSEPPDAQIEPPPRDQYEHESQRAVAPPPRDPDAFPPPLSSQMREYLPPQRAEVPRPRDPDALGPSSPNQVEDIPPRGPTETGPPSHDPDAAGPPVDDYEAGASEPPRDPTAQPPVIVRRRALATTPPPPSPDGDGN